MKWQSNLGQSPLVWVTVREVLMTVLLQKMRFSRALTSQPFQKGGKPLTLSSVYLTASSVCQLLLGWGHVTECPLAGVNLPFRMLSACWCLPLFCHPCASIEAGYRKWAVAPVCWTCGAHAACSHSVLRDYFQFSGPSWFLDHFLKTPFI